MLKAIVDKWTVAWETARGCDDDGASLSFHRFLNGDTTDFSTHNCITVTPYEWFSAADGRDWCVLFAQDACNTDQQRTWALTEEEQAFVLSNFPLFAAHFKAISDEDEPTEDAAGIVAYRAAQRARGEQYSEYQEAGDTADDAIALD